MRYIKLFENYHNNFYHGSYDKMKVGTILNSNPSGYTNQEDNNHLETFMEKHRPENKLSRLSCVFLSDNIDDIENLGGAIDYIYEVKPIGNIEKSDLAWYTEIEMTDDPILKDQYAKKYWEGVPFTNSDYSVWEYRVSSAIIEELLEENIFENYDKFQPLNTWEKTYNFNKDPQFHNLFYSDTWGKEDLKLLRSVLREKEHYVLMYHGTSCQLPIENEGLKRTKNSTKKSIQSQVGYVYLSVYPDMAKTFGKMAYPNTEICVYEVYIKIKDLKPDTDQLKNKRLWSSDQQDIGDTLVDSLLYGHGARVKRDILPYEIKKIQ